MTVVAIWYEPHDNLLWSAADTRVSAKGPDGAFVRSENGSKILGLPIACRRMFGPDNPPTMHPQIHYSVTLGYAFAGDLVPAMLTYATSGTLLQTLQTANSTEPPSLVSIAAAVAKFAGHFMRESLSASNGRHGLFTAAVYGWCEREREYQIHLLEPESDRTSMRLRSERPTSSEQVVTFGSGASELEQRMAALRSRDVRLRVPKVGIQEMLRASTRAEIGGSLSLAVISGRGLLPMRVLDYVPGSSGRLHFNGLDLDTDLGVVDQYMIGMSGMA